ncbi:hypothetical protein ES703_60220 [subsurface metagenome]
MMRLTLSGSLVELYPHIRAVPEVGSVSPSSISIVVVLPAPLGPRKPKMSPSSICRFNLSTTVVLS